MKAPEERQATGSVRPARAKERDMTALIALIKGLMIAAAAAVALVGAASLAGFAPADDKEKPRCGGAPAPACLFVIF